MTGMRFHGRRDAEDELLFFREQFEIGHLRGADGERGGLVEQDAVYIARLLQRFGVLIENAERHSRPVAAMTATGVASPSAQGQEMTSTLMA